jgi:hypothetical protein
LPEAGIPGMAFRARLTNKEGKNLIELIFKGEAVTSIDIGEHIFEAAILEGLNVACREAEIEHQIPQALLAQVAGELYKDAGLAEGKTLVPEEFDLDKDASAIDRRLAVIISTLHEINERLSKIESRLERMSSE